MPATFTFTPAIPGPYYAGQVVSLVMSGFADGGEGVGMYFIFCQTNAAGTIANVLGTDDMVIGGPGGVYEVNWTVPGGYLGSDFLITALSEYSDPEGDSEFFTIGYPPDTSTALPTISGVTTPTLEGGIFQIHPRTLTLGAATTWADESGHDRDVSGNGTVVAGPNGLLAMSFTADGGQGLAYDAGVGGIDVSGGVSQVMLIDFDGQLTSSEGGICDGAFYLGAKTVAAADYTNGTFLFRTANGDYVGGFNWATAFTDLSPMMLPGLAVVICTLTASYLEMTINGFTVRRTSGSLAGKKFRYLEIGRHAGTPFAGKHIFHRICAPLSDADKLIWTKYLMAMGGITKFPDAIIFDGESMTRGEGASTASSDGLVASITGTNFVGVAVQRLVTDGKIDLDETLVVNNSRNGRPFQVESSEGYLYPTNNAKYCTNMVCDSSLAKRIVVTYTPMRNSVYAGLDTYTLQAAKDDTTTYCGNVTSRGGGMVLITAAPWGNDATVNDIGTAHDTYEVATPPADTHVVSPIGLGMSDGLGSTYFHQADGQTKWHWNDTGHAAIGNAVADAIEENYFASGGLSIGGPFSPQSVFQIGRRGISFGG